MEIMQNLTHFDENGRAIMVDVSDKAQTQRVAIATGRISMKAETLAAVKARKFAKGDVLCVAEVAAIMAAKKTSEIIPLCHPLMLTKIAINFEFDDVNHSILISATVQTSGVTGVEMEALTAVSVCALTIYDMCKAIDKSMTIEEICLQKKTGGKSGEFTRKKS